MTIVSESGFIVSSLPILMDPKIFFTFEITVTREGTIVFEGNQRSKDIYVKSEPSGDSRKSIFESPKTVSGLNCLGEFTSPLLFVSEIVLMADSQPS